MKVSKEQLDAKIKKHQEKIKELEDKKKVIENSMTNGRIFRSSYSKKHNMWQFYIYQPVRQGDIVTSKMKYIGCTRESKIAEAVMGVLRKIENKDILNSILEVATGGKNE